jgi:hypothetical protein
MTCIAALVHEGVVYVGADSCGSDGSSHSVRKDPKLAEVGEYVIGFTTSFRMGQLIIYSTLPTCTDTDLHRFMATSFVDHIRRTMKENGALTTLNGVEFLGTFIVGVRGRLFVVESDFGVSEPACGYTAVGCGGACAIGCLYATQGQAPHQRLIQALSAATAHTTGVLPPYLIKSTCAPTAPTPSTDTTPSK